MSRSGHAIPGSGIYHSSFGIAKPISFDITVDTLLTREILQPKYDGWYAEGTCAEDKCRLRSAGNNILVVLDIPPINYGPRAYRLRGEYMYGTNRALRHPDTYLNYNIYDVIIDGATYRERYEFLEMWIKDYNEFCAQLEMKPLIFLTPSYTNEHFTYLFDEVKAGRLEGIISRNWDDNVDAKVNRWKPHFCMDYVILGMEEGQGRLEGSTGAMIGGQLKNGEWIRICMIAGMSDLLRRDTWLFPEKYVGKVAEVEGSQVFDTGAMRHPRFKRWRMDADPMTIVWKGAENGRYTN